MMSQTSKRELLRAVQSRYTLSDRTAKQHVLDEFVATTGYHRKYAIQLLNHPPRRPVTSRPSTRLAAAPPPDGRPGASGGARP
jgi:hypothetical protein